MKTRICITLDPEAADKLKELAAKEFLNESTYLNRLIQLEYEHKITRRAQK